MYNLASINVFTDGGSRGNPGEASFGIYIESSDGNEIKSIGKRIGITTNNVAEYLAIKEALVWINDNLAHFQKLEKIYFFMDSNLAVSQLNGIYKIKNNTLREIFFKIRILESEIKIPISYKHIPREENKKADKLVNLALDNKLI
jgi:ribonuclease HI